jgi:hypothetical protein
LREIRKDVFRMLNCFRFRKSNLWPGGSKEMYCVKAILGSLGRSWDQISTPSRQNLKLKDPFSSVAAVSVRIEALVRMRGTWSLVVLST